MKKLLLASNGKFLSEPEKKSEFKMNLTNRVIVITGGSKGLGKEIVKLVVKEGARVVICSPNLEEIETTAKEIGAIGIKADVQNEKQVQKLADFAVKKFGKIDVWINNAGIRIPRVPLEEMDMKRAHYMIEVNLFGAVYGAKAALLQMKKQGHGTIINILSTSALEGIRHSTGYGASKGAAVAFTKSLRTELKPFNIKVVGVYPRGMRTHFFDEKKPDDYDKYMDPTEVARQIVENLKLDNPEEEFFIKTKPSL